MGLMSPLGVGSTPPMPPNGNMWQNKFVNVTPPALQLSGSRLKTSLNSRDLEMELELLQRQQMSATKLENPHLSGSEVGVRVRP
ncbi:hypothetical protein HanPI659440_Chr02g0090601 [Helianthus annuus]|nr:hypothetical protein HanPI659440_Chr02g0090601 [Helianthus annuus]